MCSHSDEKENISPPHGSIFNLLANLYLNFGKLRYGTVRYGTVRYGTVRYGTVRYGTGQKALADMEQSSRTKKIN